jgi:hypothetical protein
MFECRFVDDDGARIGRSIAVFESNFVTSSTKRVEGDSSVLGSLLKISAAYPRSWQEQVNFMIGLGCDFCGWPQLASILNLRRPR